MKKLFNVVADLDTMTSDQMKGAIRNMEPLANALHMAFNELVMNHEDDHYDSVLDLNFDSFAGVNKFYLPGLEGGMVIISDKRLDMLLRWKLEFFAKYGNLRLDADYSRDGRIYICLNYVDRNDAGYMAWQANKTELERSSAALYESMSNTKTL